MYNVWNNNNINNNNNNDDDGDDDDDDDKYKVLANKYSTFTLATFFTNTLKQFNAHYCTLISKCWTAFIF